MPPSFKNVCAFLLFTCWSNYPVQSNSIMMVPSVKIMLLTQIKQLLIHLQRTVPIYKNAKKLKWFFFFLLDYYVSLLLFELPQNLLTTPTVQNDLKVRPSKYHPNKRSTPLLAWNETQLYLDALFSFCCFSNFQGHISLLEVWI